MPIKGMWRKVFVKALPHTTQWAVQNCLKAESSALLADFEPMVILR